MQHAAAIWKTRYIKLFEKAQEENLIRNDLSAKSIAELFWYTWQGGLLKMKIDGNTAHLKEITSILFDSLLRPSQESKE
jgi:TetR/AcrR family transcriptional repressor of nem operon